MQGSIAGRDVTSVIAIVGRVVERVLREVLLYSSEVARSHNLLKVQSCM